MINQTGLEPINGNPHFLGGKEATHFMSQLQDTLHKYQGEFWSSLHQGKHFRDTGGKTSILGAIKDCTLLLEGAICWDK